MDKIEQIKQITMQVAQGLKKDGIPVSNSKLLNYIATSNGYKSWSAYINCEDTHSKSDNTFPDIISSNGKRILKMDYDSTETHKHFFNFLKESFINQIDACGFEDGSWFQSVNDNEFINELLLINFTVGVSRFRIQRDLIIDYRKNLLGERIGDGSIRSTLEPIMLNDLIDDLCMQDLDFLHIQDIAFKPNITKNEFKDVILKTLIVMEDGWYDEVVIDDKTYQINDLYHLNSLKV